LIQVLSATHSPMVKNLFVYGTLMYQEVSRRVAGCEPNFSDAVLQGYRREAVAGKFYPAIIEDESGFVQGKLWSDLPPRVFLFLDRFEDVSSGCDVRTEVEVLTETGLKASAVVYVAGAVLRPKLCGEWDEKRFREEYLSRYFETTVFPFTDSPLG